MSYAITVQEDAFRRAEELAAVLNIKVTEALGTLNYVWRWVLTLDPGKPPTGVVLGRASCLRLEAAARWDGIRGKLVEALVELGLVVREKKKLRVKGTKPYADEWRKRADARRRERERRLAKRRAEKEAAAPSKPKLVAIDGNSPLGGALVCFSALMLARQERHNITPELAPPMNFEEWHAQLKREGLTDSNIIDGWHRYLDDNDFSKRSWPLAVFMHENVYRTRITRLIHDRIAAPATEWSRETKHGAVFAEALAILRANGAVYAVSQLEKLSPTSFDGRVLSVSAGDRYFAAWVSEHYSEIVTAALKTAHPSAEFRIDVTESQRSA